MKNGMRQSSDNNMKTFNRICIKDWEVTAENGDHFEVKRGEEVLTSAEKNGKVIVFKNFWVPVAATHFAAEEVFTA
jgi:hypothetical protein